MQKIEFGSTGLVIEKNGFGCLPIQRISETEAVKLLHKACDGGINFFDTARAYSDSEQKVGAAFSGMRDRIVLATKPGAQTAEGFWRDLETSLRTLKTDYIDIYQFHNPAFCPKPGGEDGLYDAALEAKKQGKIRHISITNHRLAVAQEAIDSGLYASLQFPFSYLAGEQELALVEGCRAHGMGFIAMKGMAGGLLRDGLTAAAWMAADVFVTYNGMKVLEAGPDCVKVQFQFGIPTVPGASAELVYTVEAQGALRVDAVYHGVAGAPELPCFGVKFETFGPVTRTVWTGLSGETYPDRYKGGVFGCHEETPHVEPHLVPQDCGMHMQTRQAMLEQRDACGHTTAALTLQQVDAPFAFSALPNTAQEIEAAQHITELPATGRTSVMVLGAVRGVGGIDSWGTDVEEPYHVSGEEDHSVSFRIVL